MIRPLSRALIPILLSACAQNPGATAQFTSPSHAADAPSARGSAPSSEPSPEDRQANERIRLALALVSEVRELPIRREVPGVRLEREAIKNEVEKMLADEAPPELVAGNTEVLFALDTVPAGFDLKRALGTLYGAELAGFYDPEQKRMVLAADLGEDAERLTLYHELVHALQDQHYDLGAGLDWEPEKSDVQAALHSLGEGDATSAMLDVFAHAAGQPGRRLPPEFLRMEGALMQGAPELAGIPGVLTRSLIAPYADGLGFVNSLRERFGGFSGVDKAWLERPLSTEHILHVDKYLKREPVVPLPDIPAPSGYSKTFRDVMGEQALRVLFEEWVPSQRATEAASDWGGDRLSVFEKAGERVVLWHLAFDNESAAERAALTFARGALRPELPPDGEAPSGNPAAPLVPRAFTDAGLARGKFVGGALCQERPQRGAFAIVRNGRELGIALGPYTRGDTGVRGAGKCPQALAWARGLIQAGSPQKAPPG